MKRVFGFGDEDDAPPASKKPKLFDDNFAVKKQVLIISILW